MIPRVDVVHVAELGLFHFDIASARLLPKVLEGSKHYPETAARIVSTGNGKALLAMFNSIIKPFMPQHTKEKIQVLGKDLASESNRQVLGLDQSDLASRACLAAGGVVIALDSRLGQDHDLFDFLDGCAFRRGDSDPLDAPHLWEAVSKTSIGLGA